MKPKDYALTKDEFASIYGKVPRLTVEIITLSKAGIYLTKRSIEPCKGQWHLPGGTVAFGESLFDAVNRIAKRELGIEVNKADHVGVIEYPSHYLKGLDHPVGIVYEVKEFSGTLRPNHESTAAGWFTRAPIPMHADQDIFLIENKYLT